jgi:hypothetical protein
VFSNTVDGFQNAVRELQTKTLALLLVPFSRRLASALADMVRETFNVVAAF